METTDKRLGVTLDGKTTYIKNGGQVVFDDGLVAEFYLDPYPPATLSSTIDVYLTRDGQALADGGVEIAYEMLAMGHGPFSAEAKKIGGGHYLVSLDYIMFGPWEQVITLRIGLQRIQLPILVVAYP
ncbi:MAG: FixH family protein [Candidatus Limnocylindrales bacterium]|nr:FixH family protein [Candidatus Limnocylindrales bacterium]